MRRNSGSFRYSGAHTNPGTPEFDAGELPKSWGSERVLFSRDRRRNISGKTLPSKWDDAERWITSSPLSGYGPFKAPIGPPQRRPTSKSGPLVSVGDGRKLKNFMANSPLTTGVLVPDGLSIHYDSTMAVRYNSLYVENDVSRCSLGPGLSDLISEASATSPHQDDERDGGKEEDEVDSRVLSRRDIATQMSPEGSTHSSSIGRLSFSTLPSSVANNHSVEKDEVRDVQMDKGTPSTTRHSEKHGTKRRNDVANVVLLPTPCDVAEESKNTAKLQREEAKINAWENLHKAKAEAAIRKLEMKLEKKRSASMDKIMNKLKAAQTKAEASRKLLSSKNQIEHTPRTSHQGISCSIYFKIFPLSDCFPRHR